MTKLSVNINKVATLRNARGGNNPDVVKVALDCEAFGAEGITVHPRPDERHIRRSDVYELRPLLTTEFNIEGYPAPEFVDLVLKVKPHQVTLVPDAPDQITSNAGWDTKANLSFLTELMDTFGQAGIRTSIFVGTDLSEYANFAAALTEGKILLLADLRGLGETTDPAFYTDAKYWNREYRNAMIRIRQGFSREFFRP